MGKQIIAFSSLLLGSAFLLMAAGVNGILMPVRGGIEGFTTAELGLLGTGWALGFVAGSLIVPHVVRRVGHVRGYGALASLAAVSMLLSALYISPVAWIVLRVITGFCFAGAAMIVESWLNEQTSSEQRGAVFSVYQMVNFAASTVGQFVIALRPPTDFYFFAVGAILYCLAILPTALSTARSPQPLATTKLDLPRFYRNSPVAAVGCVLIGMANGAFGTLGPVYGLRIGLPISQIAFLMAAAVLSGALIQFPLGWISDRMDRRLVLVAISAGAAVVGIALAVLQLRFPISVIALVAAYGMLAFPMYALTVAHANDFAENDEFVSIAGGLLLLYGLGTIAGPMLAASAMIVFAPEGLFAFTAVVHTLVAVHAVFRISRRSAPDIEAREQFRGMSLPRNATPEGVAMDPRADEPKTEDKAAS